MSWRWPADRVDPVSYTHLDVYKRQYTARAERFGGENKQRWLDLVAKYGVPDIPALAEKYGMRMI